MEQLLISLFLLSLVWWMEMLEKYCDIVAPLLMRRNRSIKALDWTQKYDIGLVFAKSKEALQKRCNTITTLRMCCNRLTKARQNWRFLVFIPMLLECVAVGPNNTGKVGVFPSVGKSPWALFSAAIAYKHRKTSCEIELDPI